VGSNAKRDLLLAAVIGAACVAGCATKPAVPGAADRSGTEVKVEGLQWLPPGTVFVLHDKRSGTYGHYDFTVGKPQGFDETQVWTQSEREWKGVKAIALSSPQMGTLIYSASDGGLLAIVDTSGKKIGSYDPPITFEWPLKVGKAWTSKVALTWMTEANTMPLEVHFRVEAFEEVTVAAGTFRAFRIVSVDSLGEVRTAWARPDLGLWCIKRVLDRSSSYPYGAGHEEDELVSVTPPK